MRLLKPGDYAVLLLGALLTALLFARVLGGTGGDRLLIRAGGRVFLQTTLAADQTIRVPGPLGVSLIEIRAGRARVAQDPGPLQICVHQGWLSRAGQAALCLPNQVSIEVQGAGGKGYDSLAY